MIAPCGARRGWFSARPCSTAVLPLGYLSATIWLLLAGRPTQGAVEIPRLEAVAPESLTTSPGDQLPKEIAELQQAVESFQKQEYERCWELLGAARKRYPTLPPARLLLARFFLAHDLLPPARVALEQAVTEEPDYPGVYLTFGELALAERRLTDALLHFEKVGALLERSQWSEQQRRGVLARTAAGLASVAAARRDWADAKKHLTDWLSLEPRSGTARRQLARVEFALKDQEAAYRDLEQSAKDDPSLEPATVAMGWLYTEQGDFNHAREWMDRAVAAAPKDVKTRLSVAMCLLYQHQPEKAKPHAEMAARLDPKSKEAGLLYGSVARHLKAYAEAEAWFEWLHRADPADLAVTCQLAHVLVEQADEAKRRRALELAESAVKAEPKSPEGLSTLGWLYYRLGRPAEAERTLQQAARAAAILAPDTAYYLARVLADRGRSAEARDLLKRALAAPGIFVRQPEAEQLLRDLTK